jgi:dihydroorotate dehydrogenase
MAGMSLASLGFRLARPLLHARDAEEAHLATIRTLKIMPPLPVPRHDARLAQMLFGLDFPNPLGLAPGFDKNAEVPNAMLRLGFGFVEVGTLTPQPQAGNPRPRLFRLAEDHAVINRMGFNNQGHWEAFKRLKARKHIGIVGVNIGANKDSADRVADYVAGVSTFSEVADYLTINISSPNTPGLRGLQSAAELEGLLKRLNEARATQTKRPAMLLKIAPDLSDAEMQDIAATCGNGAVDGVIISNTTLQRDGLTAPQRSEAGGLSGRPLFSLSTRQLAKFYLLTKGRLPLIGVGGIEDGTTALSKIEAGASLLQVYSALVYRGPALVRDIIRTLTDKVGTSGTFAALRGVRAHELAHQSEPGR